MPLSPETVKYVADLSRIELTTEELDKLSKQLQAILDFIDKLKLVDISGTAVSLTANQIFPLNNVFREDNLKESLPVEKILINALEQKNNFFIVPKVIE